MPRHRCVGVFALQARRCLATCMAAIAVAMLIAAEAAPTERSAIRWRAGHVDAPPIRPMRSASIRQTLTNAAVSGRHHVVLRFARPVQPEQRRALSQAGVELLDYVGGNAFFAVVAPEWLDAAAAARVDRVHDVQAIDPVLKLHPSLIDRQVPEWAIVAYEAPVEGGPLDEIVALYVVFHNDVSLATTALETAAHHGGTVVSMLHTINGLVIELPLRRLDAFASEDVVQWVEPPLPRMAGRNNDNRAATEAELVQDSPYDLDGSGVSVMVYDTGAALAGHQDFGGRLTLRDTSPFSDHSTHVAGTIGGDGIGSAGLYRGMAPGVTLESYGFDVEGGLSEGFLYTDPGDIEADYGEAINNFGVDIVNNSIGTNTAANGFPCGWTGNYGVTSSLIDAIVAGGLGETVCVVWSNGNERTSPRCGDQYYTTAPPACAKNHIAVGAVNANDESMTTFSSWGPCDDGRLKPDIVAPGCQSNGDTGVTSCSVTGAYSTKCGTSMAAPTVTGLAALLLQDYSAQFPDHPELTNAMLKAMLAHEAEDLGNPGPDYQTGYGAVRIKQSIDFMRTGSFIDSEVDAGETFLIPFVVEAGMDEVRVTLAWDDVPGTPNIEPSLVNDLDLHVYDPSMNRHFPWTVSPGTPEFPAQQVAEDHLNNVEQIVVEDPAPGTWRIEVRGFNVPDGPQRFALCATPVIGQCTSRGTAEFTSPRYACTGVAEIRVVDCDLNASVTQAESVVVSVLSDSEPDGEQVVLTETGPDTSDFRGAVSLSPLDTAGVLRVLPGDDLSAVYVDADDGLGGNGLAVVASATVDCAAPVISNVQIIDVEANTTVITFSTTELVEARVWLGTTCGSPEQLVSEPGFRDQHAMLLTGLEPETTYYFTLAVEDLASNPAVDTNGGQCYSFTTPGMPSSLTQEFTEAFDLDGYAVLFSPDGSASGYTACVEPIVVLPTWPLGGTALPLTDDGSLPVPIASSFDFFGVPYSTAYVGSNGYVTFTGPDGEYIETLIDHFAIPRISALFNDLNPLLGGSVSYRSLSNRLAITWQDVPEYNGSNANTFQVELYFNGDIRIAWMGIELDDGIVGLSSGAGLIPQYVDVDFDAAQCTVPESCPEDITEDAEVGTDDLLVVLGAWAAGPGAADVNRDGVVDTEDFVAILLAWGPCP